MNLESNRVVLLNKAFKPIHSTKYINQSSSFQLPYIISRTKKTSFRAIYVYIAKLTLLFSLNGPSKYIHRSFEASSKKTYISTISLKLQLYTKLLYVQLSTL